MSALICRLLGHRWKPTPLEYELSTCYAYSGDERHRSHLIPVTWVTDEKCDRCGAVSRWPA